MNDVWCAKPIYSFEIGENLFRCLQFHTPIVDLIYKTESADFSHQLAFVIHAKWHFLPAVAPAWGPYVHLLATLVEFRWSNQIFRTLFFPFRDIVADGQYIASL